MRSKWKKNWNDLKEIAIKLVWKIHLLLLNRIFKFKFLVKKYVVFLDIGHGLSMVLGSIEKYKMIKIDIKNK